MNKGLWVYCPSPMFSKTFIFQYFYILSDLFSFWNNFPPPRHLPLFVCVFFKSPFPQPCFHKYTDLICNLKLSLLNIRAVPSSAVFCSNCFSVFLFSVLITTPSSSMHFFSFLDVLSRAPTTTGMSLMLLMFHTLLISLFSSWYLSIFSFSFSLTLMSTGTAISIMAQLHSLLFTTTTSGFLDLISLSHWIITSHKIFTSSFSTTPSGACSYHFSLLIRFYFPQNFQWTILATLLWLLLYSFCANFCANNMNCSSEQLSSFSFLFRIRLLSTGHATSIIKHFFYSFPQPQCGLRCYICLSTSIQISIEFWHYHFQWQTQPCACTTFHIRLLHTSCIRPNGCSNISYRVFPCTLSVLTYCNHSLCAKHSPHVFHITCIYLRHPYKINFL